MTDHPKTEEQHKSGRQPANRRHQQLLPRLQRRRDFAEISGPAEDELLHQLAQEKVSDVCQSADTSDDAGQQKVKRLFAEPKVIPNDERTTPVPPEEVMHRIQEARECRLLRHGANLEE